MRNYDQELSWAKQQVTKTLCSNGGKLDIADLARDVDSLNKAWDELTDCLVRQVRERDRIIRNLMDELAEEKKSK